MSEGSDPVKPPVCRQLFPNEEGDEPREEGENRENRFADNLHNQGVNTFIEKYNFDPRTEKSLPGNYLWEKKNDLGEWVSMPVDGSLPQQQQQQQQQQQSQQRNEVDLVGEEILQVEDGDTDDDVIQR